jgi:hypothetical protein
MGTNVNKQNSIQKIKTRLRSMTARHLLGQMLCFLVLYPKKLNIKIHRSINMPVVLYGCET